MVDRFGNEPQSASGSRRSAATRVGVLALVAAVVVGVIVVIVSGGGSESAEDGRSVFPNSELELIDGGSFDLANLVGTPTVVNFFASWCGPCRAEMPDFQRVSQEVVGDIAFVGINTGETDVGAARQLVADTGVTYTTLLGDDGTILQEVGGLAMPTTAFVDREGTVLEVHSGILTAQALRDRIEEHFGP